MEYTILENIIWILMFAVRGAVYATPFLLGALFLSSGLFIPSETATGLFAPIVETVRSYINLIGLGLTVVSLIFWITTWIEDYQNNYLPRWVINMQ